VTTVSLPTGRAREGMPSLGLGLWGFAVAIAFGLAVGTPSPLTFLLAGLSAALVIWSIALARPFWAYIVVATSVVMLLVVELPAGRGLNLLDLLLPTLLLTWLVGGGRQEAAARQAAETGEGHDALRLAERRLRKAVKLYFAWAWLSVIPMVVTGHLGDATTSIVALARAVQGLLLFPLGLWLMTDERRIRQTMAGMCAATLALLTVNVLFKVFLDVPRAGMTWYVNEREWPIASPNEAGAAMTFVVGIVMVLHATRSHWRDWLIASAAVVMLVLTSSRSGLLSFLTFMAFRFPRARWKTVLGVALLMALALPLVPREYWDHMWRTVTTNRGTWEAYGTLTRMLTWQTAAKVFLHHPLTGVGYLGLEPISAAYNELRVHFGAESYLLEIAADLGLVGLTALGFVLVRLFHLGRVVRQVSPAGSMGRHMGAINTPLLVGILTANLTGSNLIGMVGLGQLALWSAMMIRAGHSAIDVSSARPGRMPEGTAE
jgi:hypothetical protein